MALYHLETRVYMIIRFFYRQIHGSPGTGTVREATVPSHVTLTPSDRTRIRRIHRCLGIHHSSYVKCFDLLHDCGKPRFVLRLKMSNMSSAKN